MQFASDDSSDDEPNPAIHATAASMKSMFATDRQASQTGTLSLKEEAAKKRQALVNKKQRSNSQGAASAVPANPEQSQTAIAAKAPIEAFKGEAYVGRAAIVVAVTPNYSNVMIVDTERRQLARVKIDEQIQFLPSTEDSTYATLYDPVLQLHWSLHFANREESDTFVAAVHTVQHYMMLADGPKSPIIELYDNVETANKARSGDVVSLSYTVWLLQRVGNTNRIFTVGKNIEEVPPDAPKRLVLGDNSAMLGLEEAIVGMTEKSIRMVIVPPRKTQVLGLGNPEIGTKDSVIVLFRVHAVEHNRGTVEAAASAANAGQIVPKSNSSGNLLAAPQPQAQQQISSPTGGAMGGMSNELLMQTVLMQTLQMQQALQQQQKAAPVAPPAPPPPPPAPRFDDEVPVHVERSLDRINQQLSALYEKIDRLDFEKHLERNNEKVERMVKKAVGKLPIADVDIEDVTKDREELLAKIESQRNRIEELTNTYHDALTMIGRHKDEVSAVKEDLRIQRETSDRLMKDTVERKRLELVEAAVRHRAELDLARETASSEGRDAGYKQGFDEGRIEGMSAAGSETIAEMADKLAMKEREVVDLKSQLAQLEAKMYQERREAAEQQGALQNVVDRLEARETTRRGDSADIITGFAKTLRQIMTATYQSLEGQLYATELTAVPIEDTLRMALISIKQETRAGTDMLKKQALLSGHPPIASANTSVQPTPRYHPSSSEPQQQSLHYEAERGYDNGHQPNEREAQQENYRYEQEEEENPAAAAEEAGYDTYHGYAAEGGGDDEDDEVEQPTHVEPPADWRFQPPEKPHVEEEGEAEEDNIPPPPPVLFDEPLDVAGASGSSPTDNSNSAAVPIPVSQYDAAELSGEEEEHAHKVLHEFPETVLNPTAGGSMSDNNANYENGGSTAMASNNTLSSKPMGYVPKPGQYGSSSDEDDGGEDSSGAVPQVAARPLGKRPGFKRAAPRQGNDSDW